MVCLPLWRCVKTWETNFPSLVIDGANDKLYAKAGGLLKPFKHLTIILLSLSMWTCRKPADHVSLMPSRIALPSALRMDVVSRFITNPTIHRPLSSRKTPPPEAASELRFTAPSVFSLHQPLGGGFQFIIKVFLPDDGSPRVAIAFSKLGALHKGQNVTGGTLSKTNLLLSL